MSIRIRYQTVEVGNVDIHVRTLRDRDQFGDDSGAAEAAGVSPSSWPLFGVVWESSRVLARLMLDHPVAGLRILEVGCGIGLASLILNHREANVTATDHNPDAGAFLDRNAALNDGAPIPFVREGWADLQTRLGEFDLIVGSDLIYEPDHVPQLSAFLHRHAAASCEVILIDPGRGFAPKFTQAMIDLGWAHERRVSEHTELLERSGRSRVLAYTRGSTSSTSSPRPSTPPTTR